MMELNGNSVAFHITTMEVRKVTEVMKIVSSKIDNISTGFWSSKMCGEKIQFLFYFCSDMVFQYTINLLLHPDIYSGEFLQFMTAKYELVSSLWISLKAAIYDIRSIRFRT